MLLNPARLAGSGQHTAYPTHDGTGPATAGRLPAVQVQWTGVFIAAVVVLAGSSGYRPDLYGPTADVEKLLADLALADRAAAGALLLYAVAGVLAILTVTTLTRRQHQATAQARVRTP